MTDCPVCLQPAPLCCCAAKATPHLAEVKTIKNGKQSVVENLERLLEDAKAGKILGMIWVLELEEGIAYGKCNIAYTMAIAGLERTKHNLMITWDEYRDQHPLKPD